MAKGEEQVIKTQLDENGEYVLCMDKYQFWICRAVTSKNGRNYLDNITGYYPHLEDVIYAFVERKPTYSNSDSLKKIIKILDDTRKEAKAWRKNLEASLKERGGK